MFLERNNKFFTTFFEKIFNFCFFSELPYEEVNKNKDFLKKFRRLVAKRLSHVRYISAKTIYSLEQISQIFSKTMLSSVVAWWSVKDFVSPVRKWRCELEGVVFYAGMM